MKRLWPAAVTLMIGCHGGTFGLVDGRVAGTWGGDNAGVIATDSVAHVHIGCESGYTDGPIMVDADGRFSAAGTFTVGAYPVGPGTTHPAVFSGRVYRRFGMVMEITVQLSDTARQFGPVSVRYGEEPRMGPCPICATANRPVARRMLSSGPHVHPGDPQSRGGKRPRRQGA